MLRSPHVTCVRLYQFNSAAMLTYNPRQVLRAQKSNVHHTLKRTIEDDEEPATTAWSAQGPAEKVEEESKSWLDEPPGHLEFDKKAM